MTPFSVIAALERVKMMSSPAPRRKLFFFLIAAVMTLASSACVQVLGDFETRQGGPGPGGGQKDASDGPNPNLDGGTLCTAGAKQCKLQSQELQVCNGSGWQTEATCPFLCMSGACVGVCVPGD